MSRARVRVRPVSRIASTTEIPSGPRSCGSSSEGSRVCATPSIAFDTPVISGNVSFYNETEGRAIPPTPTIAVVGTFDDVARHVKQYFKCAGDAILIVRTGTPSLAASEYAALFGARGRARRRSISRANES